jgi:pimeloyl-ACP methyl ester carboxylesterase
MTEFLEVAGGRIAYDVAGEGPLVVLAHGMGDNRNAYRFLVIMGSLDSDWPDPQAEGNKIIAAMPAGLGRLVMVEGAGHYAHTQFPDQVTAAMLPFLKEHASA